LPAAQHRRGKAIVNRTAIVAALLALVGPAPSLAQDAAPPSVKALFGNPTFSSPVISDDGKTLAVILSSGDVQTIVTRAISGGELTPVARVPDPDVRLRWLEWANSTRLLMSAHARNPDGVGMRSRVTRLFGVDADGKNFDWLGKRWPRYGQDQLQPFFQDDIVHWTPDDPNYLLIQVDPPYQDEWPRVMKMNVATGQLRPAFSPKTWVREWHADKDGQVRAGTAYTEDKFYELWTRIEPEGEFQLTIRHEFLAPGEEFLGFNADDPSKIYVSRELNGRDATYEFDLRAKTLGALVFAHPEVDIDGIVRSPAGDWRVIGVHYTTDSPQIHFLDAAAERERASLQAALAKEYGQAVQISPQSRMLDGSREILHVSSDTQPPTYFVFDRGSRHLFHLLDERPGVSVDRLSPTKRVTYQARDGLAIPAYLTLPKGRDPKNLPLIVLVHGGPWSRDLIQWDPEVQLFASRGYAVLQPNFRGSSGLGVKHLEAGYREWGQKIQDDITDGAKWAVAQGYADADRIGIYGGSFGGYAALAGLTKTPELYRAGAAYAAVTDIEDMLKDGRWYTSVIDYEETMIGGEKGDAERLRASSPLRNAGRVRVPVLLGHGVDDATVHVHQSQRMAKALRDAGKDVTYLEFPDEIHGFVLEANRIRWYTALIAFFEKNLAPREVAALHP
jgi:dipeptidyl aminopeptidase/acylaminoacyl peptidase